MLDTLSTATFNYSLANALLSSNSIAIAYFDHSLSIKEFNAQFLETLRQTSIPKSIQDVNLFEEKELQFYIKQFKEKERGEIFITKKISHFAGEFKILSIRLLSVYEKANFKGAFVFLDDITIKESSQLALEAVANHYVQDDIFQFFDSISKEILKIFNVPMLTISCIQEGEEDQSVRFATSGKKFELEDSYRFLIKDLDLKNGENVTDIFYDFSKENLEKFNIYFKTKYTTAQGIVLKNRKGEVIGAITLFDDKPIHNQKLLRKVLPIFTKKLAYEIEHTNSVELLQQSEEFFKRLFKESPLGIVMICPNTAKILNANFRICKLLGYSIKELKEKTMYEVTHADDHNIHKEKYKTSLGEDDSAFGFEKRLLKKDGTSIWCRIAVSIILDEKGNPVYDLATITDVTESKEAGDLIDSQIIALYEQNQKLEKYIDSNMELENFAYIASHDLKAPLRTIGNFTQLLNRKISKKLEQEEKEFMGFIFEGVKDMSTLIENLLMYSTVSSSGNPVDELDPNHILGNVIRNLNASIEDNNAEVIFESLPDRIVANKTKITQLFQNLIANGMKFQQSGNSPKIKIKGSENSEFWEFEVSDNGIGIAKEYHDKIFTLFKRLHGKSEFEGSGIGLAYCKRVVEKHGGKIWLESEVGKGTTFFFTIEKQSVSNSIN